jgi:hypothetical protein
MEVAMRQALSIRAAGRPTRRAHVDPVLLALAALALVILAVEAAVIVWGAPALDPTVPLYTT